MGDYTISTDRTKMNVDLIHSYLSNQSYWAKNIPKEIVNRSIENSLCFGVFLNIEQVGFARVISDFATYAYIADVFILEPHRKKGLSKLLMQNQIDGWRNGTLMFIKKEGERIFNAFPKQITY